MKIATHGIKNVLLGLFVFFISKTAYAGPPFSTDDPVPVEYKHTEIYFASTLVSDTGGISGTLPMIDMNYGLIPDLHIHATTLFNYTHPRSVAEENEDGAIERTRTKTQYGYGDTELGFKWRLIHETRYVPQLAIYPAVGIPTGNFRRGLGAGRSEVFLPVWVQKGWDKWTAYGGAGYRINRGAGNKNWTYLGGVLQRDLSKWLSLGGEINFRTRDTVDGQNGLGLNFGGQFNATENHHFLFSLGTDVHGPNHLTSYLAYQLTF